jgi:3-oxoacyl-[acyl-carrier-protein] synthase-3
MTGIRERRFWPPGTLASEVSIETGRKAIEQAGIDPREIGVLVHGSVTRDYIEPATACFVHQGLKLDRRCVVYDVSNACLGLLNGALQIANMIELGQARAGLVVGTESGRRLVEDTIAQLNGDTRLTRNDIKPAFASLTIGSGSAAILLTHRDMAPRGPRLVGGVVRASSDQSHLCRGGSLFDGTQSGLTMATDSETLLQEGVKTARAAFDDFLTELSWSRETIDKVFCHQVGRAHQRLLLDALGLAADRDFTTFDYLGNTGAVALPMTAAIGLEQGRVAPVQRAALLGIGSGINVVMLGLE